MNPGHTHGGFEIPAGADPLGRSIDSVLLSKFMGAAFDGCTSCQDTLLTTMTEDPATTARLVELACVATNEMFGGLPASMTDDSAPGLASPEFRRLARAGLDGANASMWEQCVEMTPAERRAAADTAADLVIGHVS